MHSTQSILDRIVNGPLGQKAVAEIEQDRLGRRKALVAARAKCLALHEAQVADLAPKVEAAAQREAAAERAWKTARQETLALGWELRAARQAFDKTQDESATELRQTAAPAVVIFLEELAALRNSRRVAFTPDLDAVQAEVEALLLEALPPATTQERLEALGVRLARLTVEGEEVRSRAPAPRRMWA